MSVTIELNEKCDLILNKGCTFSYEFILLDENDAVVDITGKTAKLTIKQSHADQDPVYQCTTTNGGITINGPQGKVTATIPAATTETFTKLKKGVYDVVLINGSVLTRLAEGNLIVSANVTNV